jgi:hypothetical protein
MPDTNSNGYARHRGPRDRGLRVSDSERAAVADVLREQHVQGRLASDEFQERLDRCLAAKTYAELDALVDDFPADEGQSRPEGDGDGGRGRSRFCRSSRSRSS